MNFERFLEHGSLGIVFAALMAAGIGAPVPEDLTLLVAGAAVRRGVFPPEAALPVCLIGVVAGDLMLFNIARKLGPAAAKLSRAADSPRWGKLQRWFDRYGAAIVFAARFVGGMRSAAFGVAGARGMPMWRFLLVDASAAVLSVPLMMGLGYVFAGQLERVQHAVHRAQRGLLVAALVGFAAYLLFLWFQRRRAVPLDDSGGKATDRP